MPVQFDKTTIRRINNRIRVDNEHGVTVTCDLPHELCSVNVTGWYYGKTAGLLGTYDNEPRTDLMKSDRSMATSVEELANSWTVGRRCRVVNNAKQVPILSNFINTIYLKISF